MKLRLEIRKEKFLGDTVTPVSLYLRLRDIYPNAHLLESSDYRASENSVSFLCLNPICDFKVRESMISYHLPGGDEQYIPVSKLGDVTDELIRFINELASNADSPDTECLRLFGYMSYEAVHYFEDVAYEEPEGREVIPQVIYQMFQFVISVNHFTNTLTLSENIVNGQADDNGWNSIRSLIRHFDIPLYPFKVTGKETSNFSDESFLRILDQGRDYCQVGEVFQVVLSRKFFRTYKGDEFNVYRALRSINPSPYLFYFDYGNFRLFGSSPEASLVIRNGKAEIHPIAGTIPRTGSDDQDQENARLLAEDPKENSEHIMLVDLARNDLSKNGTKVNVESFKEIHFYSHVIHLVSKVTAELNGSCSNIQVAAETFPAGTLSGAPKHRAMHLINELEASSREYYGGVIGMIGLDGYYNHAIMIRSFMSKNGTLTYQAGAGVVARSIPEKELQEVNNKLAAMRRALQMGQEMAS